jgi:hypothetical protein
MPIRLTAQHRCPRNLGATMLRSLFVSSPSPPADREGPARIVGNSCISRMPLEHREPTRSVLCWRRPLLACPACILAWRSLLPGSSPSAHASQQHSLSSRLEQPSRDVEGKQNRECQKVWIWERPP